LQSDLGDYPKPVNDALFSLMCAETKLMGRFDMPFGVSILAVAQRPWLAGNRIDDDVAMADALYRDPVMAGITERSGRCGLEPAVGVGVGDGLDFDSSLYP
jgi:hypothetical protein